MMATTTQNNGPGWIEEVANDGHYCIWNNFKGLKGWWHAAIRFVYFIFFLHSMVANGHTVLYMMKLLASGW